MRGLIGDGERSDASACISAALKPNVMPAAGPPRATVDHHQCWERAIPVGRIDRHHVVRVTVVGVGHIVGLGKRRGLGQEWQQTLRQG